MLAACAGRVTGNDLPSSDADVTGPGPAGDPGPQLPPGPPISFPGGSTTQPGTAAQLGAPSTTPFNGLVAIQDKSAHSPKHGVPAAAGIMPSALADEGLPYIPNIVVLARRDAIILYFANIAGAADYRAYAVSNDVTYVDSADGKQPRHAVIACAGFRQHTYESPAKVDGYNTRELMQAIELPGFVGATLGNPQDYTVILEATSSPCPFVGMPGHTDTTITMASGAPSNAGTNWFHANDPGNYRYSGFPHAVISSFDVVEQLYGNQIINGHGSMTSWPDRLSAPDIGLAVPPNDDVFPSDPRVIARSAIAVELPFFDEAVNAPVLDNGPNGMVDDFGTDLKVDKSAYTVNPDYAGVNVPEQASAPRFDIPGEWAFWGRLIHNESASVTENSLQVFQRHGRLYTTFGDGGQDVGGSVAFSSLRAPVQEMDAEKFVHSMFRINAEATQRRYWYWTICGGASADALYDTAAKQFKVRPILLETSFAAGGANPSVFDDHSLGGPPIQDASAIECLSITADGWPEVGADDPSKSYWKGGERASVSIRALIHPAGYRQGTIALGNHDSDVTVASDGAGPSLGFRYKVDKNRNYVGPMAEPFDQMNPLTHFNVFLRPDRLVVFINGRQAFCVDMASRPLTMKYGIIGYGDLLYHSSIEWQTISDNKAQLYQYQLNTPIASTRVWDDIGHSDHMDIPAQFATYDATLCYAPDTVDVQ
jgi:hypothetical protein